jgi:rod shape-determining protein MreD
MNGRLDHSLFSQTNVRRIIVYALLIPLTVLAQCAFFPFIDLCPATPDLMLGTLLAIALLDGLESASVCAVCGGFLLDAIGSSGLALSPIVYLVFVLTVGALSRKVLKRFASYSLLLALSLVYRALMTLICLALTENLSLPPSAWVFTEILLPEALTTALLCLPIYPVVRLCSRAFSNHSRFTF